MNICNYVSSWLGIAGDESCITKNDKRIKIANVAKKTTNHNQCKGRSEARHSNRDLPSCEGAQLALGFNLISICWIDLNNVGLIPRM